MKSNIDVDVAFNCDSAAAIASFLRAANSISSSSLVFSGIFVSSSSSDESSSEDENLVLFLSFVVLTPSINFNFPLAAARYFCSVLVFGVVIVDVEVVEVVEIIGSLTCWFCAICFFDGYGGGGSGNRRLFGDVSGWLI